VVSTFRIDCASPESVCAEGEVWPDDQATFLEFYSYVSYELMENIAFLVSEVMLYSGQRNMKFFSR
jgi:hypothetical protein